MNRKTLNPKNIILFTLVLAVSVISVSLATREACEEGTSAQKSDHDLQLIQVSRGQAELAARLAVLQWQLANGKDAGYLSLTEAISAAKAEAGLAANGSLEQVADVCFNAQIPAWIVTLKKGDVQVKISIPAVTPMPTAVFPLEGSESH